MADELDEMKDFPYGVCPAQLDGFTADGRPFYYRCRHSHWAIYIGEVGWSANCLAWPGEFRTRLAHDGEGDYLTKSEVDGLLTQHLGEGWRQATPGESTFTKTCNKCGNPFRTIGSTICSPCFQLILKGEE